MSEENVEIVRRAFGAYNRGDLKGMLDHIAPESEFRPSGRFVDSQQVSRSRGLGRLLGYVPLGVGEHHDQH